MLSIDIWMFQQQVPPFEQWHESANTGFFPAARPLCILIYTITMRIQLNLSDTVIVKTTDYHCILKLILPGYESLDCSIKKNEMYS